ncbi:putative serine protease PepD [Friedmanniella endophytica]|uniref:Putative serine protease PepD n=1 Tax=Microlunatus kandeliicorticis TaxID=1759536 RepID=A0A7W3IRS9_9ACTN|nr:trypsin-like peptidase domain-containing protein [Microlunatus kandeliicorticis]MBA8793983.1 putative serine protease PepD [Microlunatus kandeliicorticis]
MTNQDPQDQDRTRADQAGSADRADDWFWAQRHQERTPDAEPGQAPAEQPETTQAPASSTSATPADPYPRDPGYAHDAGQGGGYWTGPHDSWTGAGTGPGAGGSGGYGGWGGSAGYGGAQPTGQPYGTGLATQQLSAPTRTKRRGRGGLLVASLALAALVGAGAGVGSYAYVADRNGVTAGGSPISTSSSTAPQAPALNGSIEAAAAKIQPSVVTITVQSGQSGDIGSGVVLNKQGYILTNNHVVAAQTAQGYGRATTGSPKITVTFNNGRTASATVVGTAETEDLAVIKVDGVDDLTPATFASSGSLRVGQSVIAAGAPLGLSETITSGIVSSTARPVRSGDNNDAVYLAVQTDAAINPGNSGGALVDLNGAVVGINSSIATTGSDSADGGQSGNIGIGFAIPSDVATRVAQQLIESGKSPDAALGVTVSNTQDSALGTTSTGVALDSVNTGGAAAKAGLRAGDKVTKINDFETTTPDGLIAATRYYAPGTTVTVTYVRDGQTQTARVTLGSL